MSKELEAWKNLLEGYDKNEDVIYFVDKDKLDLIEKALNDKEKLLKNLELYIKNCKEDLDKLNDKIKNTSRDPWGNYETGFNYDEIAAHTVGCLDAYNAIKNLIEKIENGQYE